MMNSMGDNRDTTSCLDAMKESRPDRTTGTDLGLDQSKREGLGRPDQTRPDQIKPKTRPQSRKNGAIYEEESMHSAEVRKRLRTP